MKPKEGLSTPVVFQHLDLDQLSPADPVNLLEQFTDYSLNRAEYVNDLESPAFKAMPSLQQMKLELQVFVQKKGKMLFLNIVAGVAFAGMLHFRTVK